MMKFIEDGINSMEILVLGASGMLGSSVFKTLSKNENFNVYGTIRRELDKDFFSHELHNSILANIDVENDYTLSWLFDSIKPDVTINCIGIVKQLEDSKNIIKSIVVNSLLPHKLNELCKKNNSRLIHISTDCVFSGNKGMYDEEDESDVIDIYGRTKSLGEVISDNCVTIRTSIIGHELKASHGLLNWFLKQEDVCNGYTDAFFSGVPTIVLSDIIENVIIPDNSISGLYHVSSDRISKFDLLKLISKIYNKNIVIKEDSRLKIDRSLNGEKFYLKTGYKPKSWGEMIVKMAENN